MAVVERKLHGRKKLVSTFGMQKQWQVSFAGHRSQVIVLLKKKVSQTLVKANLRPN